jgi:hypothetical protein
MAAPLHISTSWLGILLIAACGCGGGNQNSPSAPQQTVAVSISPTSATVQSGGATQQFTAAITGTSNQAVTWNVNNVMGGNPSFGTISPQGVYTSPASVPNSNTATVTVTSMVDSTKAASATIMIPHPSVSRSPSPATALLFAGTNQQVSATVTGTLNSSVLWSVNGITAGNASVGNISANLSSGEHEV